MEFKQAIKMYLDVNAMQDTEFGAKYSNPDKNIDECCLYIQSTMLKKAMEGKDEKKTSAAVAVPTDEEVFALAVQYYMDDDLKVDGSEFNNVKMLSISATTFTDEEKEQMRKDAIKEYQDEVIAEAKKRDEERKNKTKKAKEKKPSAPVIVPDAPSTKEGTTTTEKENNNEHQAQQLSLF